MNKFICSLLTLVTVFNCSVFKTEAMANDKLFLAFVIDESGSMRNSRSDTIGSFNSLINEHKNVEDDVDVFVVTNFFNNSNHFVHRATYIQDVEDISEQDYSPKGGTALLDAVGDTVGYLDELLEENPDSSVMLVIITDGEENSSKKYDKNTIREILEDRQDSGWNVEFYGAGIDAYNDAKKLGFTQKNSICFTATSKDPHVVGCMAKMACVKSMECRRQISGFDNVKINEKNSKEIEKNEIKNDKKKSILKSLKLKLKRFKRQILKLFKKTQKSEKQ